MDENTYNSLREKAYHLIKKNIITGVFESGTVYMTTQLAKLFDMSRTPVREALIMLANEGLINGLPGSGFLVPEIGIKTLCELSDVNRCIETFAISEIRRNKLDYDIDVLKDYLEKQKEAFEKGDIWRFYQLNWEFHQEIIKVTGNSSLYNIGKSNVDKIIYAGYKTGSSPQKLKEAFEEHEEIIRALELRDIDRAIQAINNHYINAKRRLIL